MNLLNKFKEKTPHALVLVGDPKIVEKAAYEFVASLPIFKTDIHSFSPEGKTGIHPFLSIKKMLQEAPLPPYQGEKKCFVIHDAERMSLQSGNALLKVVEEPPPRTLFLLLTSKRAKILPTLLSRCQTVFFPEKEEVPSPAQTLFLSFLNKEGPLQPILDIFDKKKKELTSEENEGEAALEMQEDFLSLLATYQHWYNKQFAQKLQGSPLTLPTVFQVERAQKEALQALERNISYRTILETFILRVGF